jgi:flavin-dependent dehydrogenase
VASGLVSDGLFIERLLEALSIYAPAVAARVDPRRFRLRGPLDSIQGALTPTVRRAHAILPSGKLAVAVGDAWITNDPLAAQGANLGSHCAWVAADAIAGGGPFDTHFGEDLEGSMWEFAGPVTTFSNALLQPPQPHLVKMITTAGSNSTVASAFVSGFADPVRTSALLGDPGAVDDFLAAMG